MAPAERVGRQEPTFELRPESASNAAVECIELYESLGPRLDPWQRHVLTTWLGEDKDGLWATPEVALQVARQNGKGAVTEAVELAGLFVWGERTVLHTAHRLKTEKASFKRVLELVDGSDDLRRRVRRVREAPGAETIELLSGASLTFATRTGSGGRGLTGDRVVLDEAQELTADQMEGLVPTILARPDPQIVYTFTPPKHVAAGVMRLRKRARDGDAGLAYCEWANEPGADLEDERVIARANPAYGFRVSRRTLRIARGALDADGYARECGGIWPEETGAWLVIGREQWRVMRDPAAQLVGDAALAVAVPRDRSAAAVASGGVRAAGGRMGAIVAAGAGTEWVVPMLADLERQRRPLVLVIDDKTLADQAEAAGLVVYRPTAPDMVSSAGLVYDGVTGPARDVWHLGEEDLGRAVARAERRDLGASWAWARSEWSHVLVAWSLAVWAAATPRIHRPRVREAAAAYVRTVPHRPASRAVSVPVVDEGVDVNAARLREQLERDLARSSR